MGGPDRVQTLMSDFQVKGSNDDKDIVVGVVQMGYHTNVRPASHSGRSRPDGVQTPTSDLQVKGND